MVGAKLSQQNPEGKAWICGNKKGVWRDYGSVCAQLVLLSIGFVVPVGGGQPLLADG